MLVTGASGFTGPYINDALKKRSFIVIGSSSSKGGALNAFDDWVEFDIRSKEQTFKAIESLRPTHIIHLAGISFVGHSVLEDFYTVNVLGTENLLWSVVESGIDVENILISSSANVYGSPENDCKLTEDSDVSPQNHYAISKFAAERVGLNYSKKLPIIIARPFNYIGSGQNDQFVIPKIVSAFARGDKIIDLGDITVSRDFSSVVDTVDAYAKLLDAKLNSGETFNVCSGRPTCLQDVIELMNQIAGYSIKVTRNPDFIRANEIKSLYGLNDKLKSVIDWCPVNDLRDILEKMYLDYKASSA